mmetsp:Transcript_65695/g.186461  ORF Transcript_65695/g.186461 Transcript_65695/m.186461 type:complete len:93 (+) Transcript_65695:72-350(+)
MTTSVNPAAKPPPHWGDDRLKDTLHVAKDKLAGGLEHLHEHGKEGFDFAKEQTHKGFDYAQRTARTEGFGPGFIAGATVTTLLCCALGRRAL